MVIAVPIGGSYIFKRSAYGYKYEKSGDVFMVRYLQGTEIGEMIYGATGTWLKDIQENLCGGIDGLRLKYYNDQIMDRVGNPMVTSFIDDVNRLAPSEYDQAISMGLSKDLIIYFLNNRVVGKGNR